MRTAFLKTLSGAAAKNKNIMLLTGDLGFGVLEPFSASLPKQFINMGIAEQNLTSFAAGLAISGKIPIIYSIATFATLRNYEQIRNDICYQKLNVKIVGVGSGLTYSQYGATHQSMEDIGLMRLLPNMTILCPGDPLEAATATKAMLEHKGPCYLRIASRGEPNIHTGEFNFQIGKGIVLCEDGDIALIATGNILENAVKAAGLLKEKGVLARVISMPTVKPLDKDLILKIADQCKYLFTIEEHSKIGGLGSAVAELLAEHNAKTNFTRIAGPDSFQPVGGWLDYIRELNGLTPEKIADKIMAKI